MELTQSRTIAAPVDTVWKGLNDPATLKASIAGCETFEQVGEGEWRAVVASRIGPVQARFTGKVLVQDVRPGEGYTLKFEGQGGAAGFANGEARVSLAAAGDATPVAAEIATPAPAATPVAPAGGAPWIRYAALAGIVLVLVVLYLYRAR
jgi:carbon monoxide dehydrogenase subunit G